jgi:hypothetical protein
MQSVYAAARQGGLPEEAEQGGKVNAVQRAMVFSSLD